MIMATNSSILAPRATGTSSGIYSVALEQGRQRSGTVRALLNVVNDGAVALRDTAVDIFVGDMNKPADVTRTLEGIRRLFFRKIAS